jgi:hypothetical protein
VAQPDGAFSQTMRSLREEVLREAGPEVLSCTLTGTGEGPFGSWSSTIPLNVLAFDEVIFQLFFS